MAISLNDHEQRIKNTELQLPDIESRITELENNPGGEYDCFITSLSVGGTISIDSKYTDYDMCLIKLSHSYGWSTRPDGSVSVSSSSSNINFSYWSRDMKTVSNSIIKSGNVIKFQTSGGNYQGSATILLYKQITKTLYYKVLDKYVSWCRKYLTIPRMLGGEIYGN